MKTFLQGQGTVVTVTCPSGGVVSGQFVAIRQLFGVAQHDAAAGARLEVMTWAGPVITVSADTNLQIDVGDRVFWDAANGWVDKTTTAQSPVGIAIPLDTLADIAKATTGTTVRLLLGGTPVAGA